MRLQIGGIDHDGLRIGAIGGQAHHDPGEDAVIAATLSAIVEDLDRSIFPRRTVPAQAFAVDKDNAAQNPQLIHAWAVMALGKEQAKTRHVRLSQPEQVAH
jgi:hypothetical protein